MSGVRRFSAMGCEVLVGGAPGRAFTAVVALFEDYERRFSRFRRDSELCAVNASPSPIVNVSTPFARALELALDAAAETGGLVDPTLGIAIEHAGYTRDFAVLSPDPAEPGPGSPGVAHQLSARGRLVHRPPGVQLDLNGVVKALAVDEAVALLPGNGFVSAGGDLATRGPREVALPGGGAVRLLAGALATSGKTTRRWLRGGRVQHHLIDPSTGRPSESPWEEVTVCGSTCYAADVAAKAAFLLGAAGPAWLEQRGLPGRFVAAGRALTTSAWPADACLTTPCT